MLYTLMSDCQHHEDIRRSRFLAQASMVETPQQALAFMQMVSDRSATHNCWAYRIGQEYRFNDDGEPSGTAGRPILQAIEGQSVDHVIVVVTRWYGGIKLGAGGLARAYGGTAAECLRLAKRAPLIAMARLGVRCDFADLAMMKARLKEIGAQLELEQFDSDAVTLQWRLPEDQFLEAKTRVINLSRGRITPYLVDGK